MPLDVIIPLRALPANLLGNALAMKYRAILHAYCTGNESVRILATHTSHPGSV